MKTLFSSLALLSEKELDRLDGVLTHKILKKGEYLIEENQICNEIVFIKSGALRSFYRNNDGDEITNCITFENELMAAFSSFVTQNPTNENIQAIFDTELQVLHRDDLEKFYENSIEWQKLGRTLSEIQYVALEKRIALFQKFSGKERYEELFKLHTKYIQFIPLQYLASFLGVTPRHLSRIRKSII
ncbi:Crp/Fnr family transcriptional regulator [Flavobacterium sp. '19STA2R22 D10 B1']|uniref:Crp/Fnr family transcriptional regulator n=1 Tax=Flavobacterium aerium TaxID=3037261 RepID=UPI00278BFEC4|nr:Crp/Fnr family transcriptional regulator [Flavobacterium sp. '19STA2R22 D10 B1']